MEEIYFIGIGDQKSIRYIDFSLKKVKEKHKNILNTYYLLDSASGYPMNNLFKSSQKL